MNKYKKIAAIAVTAVMAGSMVGMMAACAPEETSSGPVITEFTGYTANTKLNLNIGNQNSKQQGIKFTTDELSGTVTLADGIQYTSGSLKPAWRALSEKLQLTFEDAFTNEKSDAQIEVNQGKDASFSQYDVITASLAKINEFADTFVDLSQYLDLMPNYKAFLEANPVVRYSLTGDPSGSSMYAAPYFDGLNDIEKYQLFNQVWVSNILDAEKTALDGVTQTLVGQLNVKKSGTTTMKSSIKAYMGSTDWSVATTNREAATDGQPATVTLNVKYSAALADAKDFTNKPLGQAIKAAYDGVTEVMLTSGNIVDLMNVVIDGTNGDVTGGELIAILQAYIDVAYQNNAGTKFYATRSDVFNGVDAGWDVDLLAALSRCVVSSHKLLTNANLEGFTYAIAAREGKTNRRNDLIALAGTLYGFRGADATRYEYTYIDKDGNLCDARNNAETYDLIANLSGFANEGLLYTGESNNETYNKTANGEAPQAMMIHDYAQTQTTNGIATYDSDGVQKEINLATYNFAPVVTPVSKWDENCDSNDGHESIMRFTESWRSVKNTGFAVPKHVESDTNKLQAVIAMIDYIFSNDGQILMTYGDIATNTGFTNGWWKGTEATNVKLEDVADVYVAARTASENTDLIVDSCPTQYTMKANAVSQYFVYNGKVYTGTSYNGRVVPTLTDNNMTFYLGGTVNGITQATGGTKGGPMNQSGNYTNYARRWIGTTLPIGNKDQGFEYQGTALCALTGAAKVSAGLVNGTIKHVKLSLDAGESMWYLIVPTAMPYSNAQRTTLKSDASQSKIGGTYFVSDSTATLNVFLDLAFYGFNTSLGICGSTTNGNVKANGTEYVTWIRESGLTARLNIMQSGWNALKRIYNIGTTATA